MGLDGMADLFLTSTASVCASTATINLGDPPADGNGINGQMDEVRFSSIARYPDSTSYTVPTAEFCYDADTVSLLHLNVDFTEDVGDPCGGGAATYRQPDIFIITTE